MVVQCYLLDARGTVASAGAIAVCYARAMAERTAKERNAIRLIAGSHTGITEALLASHGIGRDVLDKLIREGIIQVSDTHLAKRGTIVRIYSLVPLSKRANHRTSTTALR
jgi:hypothetical protein